MARSELPLRRIDRESDHTRQQRSDSSRRDRDANRGLDGALAKRIQLALIDLDKSEAGRRVIANGKKKLTGHVIAEDSLFDVVRRTAKIAGK